MKVGRRGVTRRGKTTKNLLVGKIDSGVVIDHIAPGKGLLILQLLNPGPGARVVMANNVPSRGFKRKDLVKIEGEFLTSSQIDTISLISPNATVNRIESYVVKQKRRVRPPSKLKHLLDCRNPNCPSRGRLSVFSVSMKEPIERSYFECSTCGYRIYYDDGIERILTKASTGILISREKIQSELLDLLVRKGGLRLNQRFKLKSGRVSPYFVNLGALTDGESLLKLRWVLAGFAWLLLNEGKISDFDFVFGPAYKGINMAALTCEGFSEYTSLNKRYLYDRKETKKYGDLSMDGQIVGGEYFKRGQKILIIDDTITTGQTKFESTKKLSFLKRHKLVGIIVCVDRQEKAEGGGSAMEEIKGLLGVKVHPILTAQDIYRMVRRSLSTKERRAWVDYYRKYGVIKLE